MNRNKNYLFFLGILLSFLFITCDKENEEKKDIEYLKFKQIAWNSLSTASQESVTHDWKDAEAKTTKNPDNDEDVVLVVFHTIYDALTCPISVYIDIETEEVIFPENILLCD